MKVEIRTVAEATQRASTVGSVTVQEMEETADTVAAGEELRAYFAKNNPGRPTDEAIRSYSSRVVNRAYRTLFHAIELRKLINRLPTSICAQLLDARAKWLTMLRQHAAAFAQENVVLRQEIQPIFFPGSSLHVAEDISIESDADLARAVEGLHKLALSNNVAIRSAFTISAQSSEVAIKSTAFWQSMQRAENLAKALHASTKIQKKIRGTNTRA